MRAPERSQPTKFAARGAASPNTAPRRSHFWNVAARIDATASTASVSAQPTSVASSSSAPARFARARFAP